MELGLAGLKVLVERNRLLEVEVRQLREVVAVAIGEQRAAEFSVGRRLLRSRDMRASCRAGGFSSGNRCAGSQRAEQLPAEPGTDTNRTKTNRGCIAEVPALEGYWRERL